MKKLAAILSILIIGLLLCFGVSLALPGDHLATYRFIAGMPIGLVAALAIIEVCNWR